MNKFKKEIHHTMILKNHVLIKVSYSNINYKDILMSRGHRLIKKFPTPGIDASELLFFEIKKFKVNIKFYFSPTTWCRNQ